MRARHHAIAWGLAVLAAAVWCALAVSQWRGLVVPSWDLGIFTQLADAYSRLDAPIVDIKGAGTHLLGDHWHPILVLLGPLYRLAPSGLTLLLVQGVLFALSVIPITRVALERLGTLLGAGAGVAYALSWGLASAAWAQFHEIAVAVPLLALSLAAYLRGRWRACALWVLPLVAVKEDLGLTVAALGAVLLWRGWRRARRDLLATEPGRWGAVLVVWGVAWFVLTITLLLPAFNAAGQWDYTARLDGSGADGGGPLAHLLADPGTKLGTVLLLVLAAGVLGAASPLMVVMVPTLAWRFLGEVPMYWGTHWHYSAVLMPIAAASLIDVAGRLRAGSLPRGEGARREDPTRRTAPTIAVAVALLTTAASVTTGPVARLTEPEPYAWSWRAPALRAAAERIPDGQTVTTDLGPLAYLVPHARVRWVGNASNDPASQWVLLDEYAAAQAHRDGADAAAWAEATWPGTRWESVRDEDGYALARNVTSRR